MLRSAGSSIRDEYAAVVAGDRRDGARGRIAFCTSTADLASGRGDLYVALGLATALAADGWGAGLWPAERWDEPGPDGTDVAIVMIETHIPARIPAGVRTVAWVRNWTEAWSQLPYLDAFDAIWCSSSASAELLRKATGRPVEVVPLAADPRIFRPDDGDRDPRPVVTANFWGADRGLFREIAADGGALPVAWYGVRGAGLDLPPSVEYLGRADYFDLGRAYGSHRYVVDDVIAPAAAYGNQNSRLFEALAAGALVVTNTAEGLAELGLERVPVYPPGGLPATIAALNADPAGSARLVGELRAVVLERHTWERRAAEVGSLLESVLAAPAAVRPEALLEFAADHQARRRAAEAEADGLRRTVRDLRAEVEAFRTSTSWRITAPLRRLRRPRPEA